MAGKHRWRVIRSAVVSHRPVFSRHMKARLISRRDAEKIPKRISRRGAEAQRRTEFFQPRSARGPGKRFSSTTEIVPGFWQTLPFCNYSDIQAVSFNVGQTFLSGTGICLPQCEKDGDGITALMMAAGINKNPDVIATLIKAGAEVNARSKEESSALIAAAFGNDNPKVIELLIKAGAEVNTKNKNGGTPLMMASWNRTHDIVEMLIKAGADVNAKDKTETTPLMMAARDGACTKTVLSLIKAGAEVNVANKIGWTPLMIAAKFNQDPVAVTALIKAGADVNAKSHKGKSVLMCSQENKNKDIVSELIKAGAK